MTENNKKPSQSEEGIEQSIELWKNSIVMFAALLLGALIGYFWFYVKHLPPDPTATDRLGIGDWGAFGDFMGGLMNPIVAFAALYWLTQSVKLQKTELAETRKALEGSEQAQKAQADHSAQNLRIASRAALVSALQSQIDARQTEIAELGLRISKISAPPTLAHNIPISSGLFGRSGLAQSMANSIDPSNLKMRAIEKVQAQVKKLESERDGLIKERDHYLDELRSIVKSS